MRYTIVIRITFFERLPALRAPFIRTTRHEQPTPSRRGQLESWFRSVAPLTDAAYVLWGFSHRSETSFSGPAAAVCR